MVTKKRSPQTWSGRASLILVLIHNEVFFQLLDSVTPDVTVPKEINRIDIDHSAVLKILVSVLKVVHPERHILCDSVLVL